MEERKAISPMKEKEPVMDTTPTTSRPAIATVTTAPRPTPKPVRIHFSEVMASTVVAGAESAIRALPGGPTMAIALRGGGAARPASLGVPMAAGGAPEGPGGVAPGGAAGAGDGGIESSLAQSQDMNLYYLQIQEEVNAQNRSFTALSNVLKAEHDTVKTAIGNIR
jgi:hypothetical protein